MITNISNKKLRILLGLCCAAVLLLGAFAVSFVYRKTRAEAVGNIGQVLDSAIAEVSEKLNLPETERRNILAQISFFQKEIAAGKIGYRQGIRIANAFTEGPFAACLAIKGFAGKFVTDEKFSSLELKNKKLIINQVLSGLLTQKIPVAKIKNIRKIIAGNKARDPGFITLNYRNDLGKTEILEVLELLEKASRQAQITAQIQPVELGKEAGKIIRQSKKYLR